MESHWPARAKCSVMAWQGGRGYAVRFVLHLMHHDALRCCFNRQRSNNEGALLILTQADTLRGGQGDEGLHATAREKETFALKG